MRARGKSTAAKLTMFALMWGGAALFAVGISRGSSMDPVASLGEASESTVNNYAVVTAVSDGLPGIGVTNEYVERDGYPETAFPAFDVVVMEPFKATTFVLLSEEGVSDANAEWTVRRLAADQSDVEVDLTAESAEKDFTWTGSGAEATTALVNVGLHRVEVTTGSTTVSGKFLVRYVRRELRDVLEADRVILMEAFATIASTSDTEGQAAYGSHFMSLGRLAAEHNNYGGDKQCDRLHDGMGFVVSHLALTRLAEASLQSVDPRAVLHYWEYTRDVEEIYAKRSDHDNTDRRRLDSVDGSASVDGTFLKGWPRAEPFTDKWFGKTNVKGGELADKSATYFADYSLKANEYSKVHARAALPLPFLNLFLFLFHRSSFNCPHSSLIP